MTYSPQIRDLSTLAVGQSYHICYLEPSFPHLTLHAAINQLKAFPSTYQWHDITVINILPPTTTVGSENNNIFKYKDILINVADIFFVVFMYLYTINYILFSTERCIIYFFKYKHATLCYTSSIFLIQFLMFSNDRSLVMSYTNIIPCSQQLTASVKELLEKSE